MLLTKTSRIAIIGSGAIGCYYGARLAQHGYNVHFLMRSDFAHVQAHGLEIRSHHGDFSLPTVQCHRHPDAIGPCDLVIIALKTTANVELLRLLPPLLHGDTLLLTLQNGLGNEEFLARHFGPQRILGGLCFVCINRLSPGVIDHSAQGLVALGEHLDGPRERTLAIADAFSSSNIPCSIEPSLAFARWKKLVWNIPFNGLSIIAGGLDTEHLLASPSLPSLIRDLMREVIDAASRLGHQLPSSLVEEMIQSTLPIGPYKTSSLLDYLEGREVELDAIWKEPCRQARAAGASVPKLEMLCQLLEHQLHKNPRP